MLCKKCGKDCHCWQSRDHPCGHLSEAEIIRDLKAEVERLQVLCREAVDTGRTANNLVAGLTAKLDCVNLQVSAYRKALETIALIGPKDFARGGAQTLMEAVNWARDALAEDVVSRVGEDRSATGR